LLSQLYIEWKDSVHYTREPIIETVVTPREGHKLVVRSSRGAGQEEYFVDALEVVSFGSALFFRSIERPKSFLLPVSDYEVVEVRETRVVLKHIVSPEKSTTRARVEVPEEEAKPAEKKSRRRSRRRRTGEGKEVSKELLDQENVSEEFSDADEEEDEFETTRVRFGEVAPIATLLPPPTELISDTIDRFRQMRAMEGEFVESNADELLLPEPLPELRDESDEEASSGMGPATLLKRLTGRDAFSPLPPVEGSEGISE
jgi:hypothetical protein